MDEQTAGAGWGGGEPVEPAPHDEPGQTGDGVVVPDVGQPYLAAPVPAAAPGGASSGPGRSSAAVAVVALVATLVVLVAVGSVVALVVAARSGHDVTGSITVLDSDFTDRSPGGSCSPDGGYSDIDAGGQVTIEDGSGTTLAVGSLGSGTLVDILGETDGPTTTRSRESSDVTIVGCRLSITVADVPDADFYRVQIGRREPFQISRADLEADGWTLDLSIGDAL